MSGQTGKSTCTGIGNLEMEKEIQQEKENVPGIRESGILTERIDINAFLSGSLSVISDDFLCD